MGKKLFKLPDAVKGELYGCYMERVSKAFADWVNSPEGAADSAPNPRGIEDFINWEPSSCEQVQSVVRVRDTWIVTTDSGVYKVSEDCGLRYKIEKLAWF